VGINFKLFDLISWTNQALMALKWIYIDKLSVFNAIGQTYELNVINYFICNFRLTVDGENDHLIKFQLIEIVFYHLIEIMLIA
jgi:hypothetical protein